MAKKSILIGVNTEWLYPALILIFAAALRIAFFSRGLGTDEIVYISQAYRLLGGELPHATYLGAIRYGINGFQAASIKLFGNGVVGADGLFFACSLSGILLAYAFAFHLWGRGAAIWTALALAVLPLDVTLAGSLNPDAYLALFVATSIIVFYVAQNDNRADLYLLSGLLAGWVFWIKEEVIVFGLFFVGLAMLERRWRSGWLFFLLGGALCAAADLIFFWVVYGEPFYHYSVVRHAVGDLLATRSFGETAPWAYITYLFVKIYHTGLLGWLALAGGVLAVHRRNRPGTGFVLAWAIGLLLIFSLLPVSFFPMEFIRKQANYMEVFVMPLALLAGWFLAQQGRMVALVLGAAMVVSGILLSALQQQVVRVVTVNGRAAAAFAEAHAGTPVFGPLTAQRQSMLNRLLRGSLDDGGDIRPVADLAGALVNGGPAGDTVAYLVEDPQMRNWQDAATEVPLPDTVRACLMPAGPLGGSEFGLGRPVVAALRSMVAMLPTSLGAPALRATDALWQVAPAQVYAITRECARQAQDR